MNQIKTKAWALLLSVFFSNIITLAIAQNKSEQTTTPVVTKGYYSIFNNAEKLNSTAGRLTFAPKSEQRITPGPTHAVTPKKGYYSIGKNAEANRSAVGNQGIDFTNDAPARVLQAESVPTIKKGYYSIGNNYQKLRR